MPRANQLRHKTCCWELILYNTGMVWYILVVIHVHTYVTYVRTNYLKVHFVLIRADLGSNYVLVLPVLSIQVINCTYVCYVTAAFCTT